MSRRITRATAKRLRSDSEAENMSGVEMEFESVEETVGTGEQVAGFSKQSTATLGGEPPSEAADNGRNAALLGAAAASLATGVPASRDTSAVDRPVTLTEPAVENAATRPNVQNSEGRVGEKESAVNTESARDCGQQDPFERLAALINKQAEKQAETSRELSEKLAEDNKRLSEKIDKQSEKIDKLAYKQAEDNRLLSEKLDRQVEALTEKIDRQAELCARQTSELREELASKMDKQAETHQSQCVSLTRQFGELKLNVNEHIAACNSSIEKQKEVSDAQAERIDLAEARIESIQETVQTVRAESDTTKRDLVNRMNALEQTVIEGAGGVSDEQLRTAIECVKVASTLEISKVNEKVAVLASTVEQMKERQETSSDRTVPAAVSDSEEVRDLLNFKRNQIEINRRQRERIDRLYEPEDLPEEQVASENRQSSKRKRNAGLNQEELEDRLRRLRGEESSYRDRSPVGRNVFDMDDCKRHFVSVQSYAPFPGDDNQTHPKMWLDQFNHTLPDSWDDGMRIEFVMSHLRGQEAVTMRSKGCRTFAEFRATFLEEFWSPQMQERVEHEIIMKENYADNLHGSPLDYFRSLVRANQHLDAPYPASKLIGICMTKLPPGLKRDITIAGRGLRDVKQFQQLLQDLGADKRWCETQQAVHFVQNPPRQDNQGTYHQNGYGYQSNNGYNNNNNNNGYQSRGNGDWGRNGRRQSGRQRRGNNGRRSDWSNHRRNSEPPAEQATPASTQEPTPSPSPGTSGESSNVAPQSQTTRQ